VAVRACRHKPARWWCVEGFIRRRGWKWVAAALALVLVLWFLDHEAAFRAFDWRLAASSFTHLRISWMLLALGFAYLTYWARALRWAVFLRPLKPNPSMVNLLSATVVGFMAVTLLGRPGEFVRPYLIAIKEQVSVTSQLAAWVLERIADLSMVLLLFGFALNHVSSSGLPVGPRIALVLGVGGRIVAVAAASVVVVLVVFRHFTGFAPHALLRFLQILPQALQAKAGKFAEGFLQGVESVQSGGALFLILLYSVLEWVLIVASYGCLVKSFAQFTFTIVDIIVFMGFVSLGASIQIPGVGGGVQVMVVLVLTEIFHSRVETAAAFAFFAWILTFVAVVPPGLIISFTEGLTWWKLGRTRARKSS
jgi:glycosyltransferase 2 family protein